MWCHGRSSRTEDEGFILLDALIAVCCLVLLTLGGYGLLHSLVTGASRLESAIVRETRARQAEVDADTALFGQR